MSYKISETKARARIRFIAAEAKDAKGDVMKCECGSGLGVYELMRESEEPKHILCCAKKKCDNSAYKTAEIFRATLVGMPGEGER